MHYTKPSASRLLELMEQHIVILDGAMGTMIQQHNLTEEDFRGKGFLEKTPEYLPVSPLQGNNDLLSITRPDVIEDIHLEFLNAGTYILETNTFNANRISQADYNLQNKISEINLAAAQVARNAADSYRQQIKLKGLPSDQPIFIAGSILSLIHI